MTAKHLSGDLLVFGGVYGNLPAFVKLLEIAEKMAIPSARFVCCGDFAAYCAQGEEVCRLARREMADSLVVRGNCERALALDEDNCGCGFSAGTRCQILSDSWYRHARRTLSESSKKWFATLPPRENVVFAGKRVAVVHAAADSDNEFIFRSDAAARKLDAIRRLNVDGVIAGHCGIPFTQPLDGNCLWHNSGALGMPANDGTARVWFSVWTETAAGIRIRHCALSYPVEETQLAITAASLPDGYRRALSSGIWPSDSVLPAAEKRRQGQPLQLSDTLWRH